jgi:ATP-binding cassette subfamily B protein
MWHYAPDKKLFFWMITFSIIGRTIRIAEPYVFWKIINLIQLEGKEGRNEIFFLLILFASMTFLNRCFHGISRVREEKIKFQVAEACTTDLFDQVASLPMEWHTDNHSGKTIDKISKASSALKEFAGMNFMYTNTVVFGIGSFVSLTLIRRPAGIIIAVLSVITMLCVQKFDHKLIKLITEKNTKEHEVMSGLFDFLGNIKTVITLRFEDRALSTIRHRIRSIFPVFRQHAILNEWKWFTMDMLMAISVLTILVLYLHHEFTTTGVVLIGTFTMLWQYIEKMKWAFGNFTRQRNELMQMSTNYHTIDEITTAYTHLPKNSQQVIFDAHHPFHLQNLCFSYANQWIKNKVLNNISLDLTSGKRIALVGSSGSGKSTLMMLLRGLYPVDKVSLHIADQQFSTLEPLSHYASLIPQDPEIFEQTIRYNITMGLDVDDSTVLQMCDLACFSEVLTTLPHGLDTDIKEKWVNLSGGQKQRLALARGLLMARKSRLLLLDESTSSVDVHNEKKIYEQIFTTYTQSCIVASIHKLHLLPLFDYIYVIDKGIIQEHGSFSALLAHPKWQLSALRAEYQITLGE